MESIVCQERIRNALRSKHPSAKNYLIRPGENVCVYQGKTRQWNGPFKLAKVSDKMISVTDGANFKHFKLTGIIQIAPTAYDTDLRRDINQIERYYLTHQYENKTPIRYRTKSQH